MTRLPLPGGDKDQWGDILNDFLGIEHNADGSQKPLPQSKVTNLTTDLAVKVNNTRTVNGQPLSADVTITKSDVGLGNADNTSDLNKPVSTAQQAALTAHDGNASAHPALRTRLDTVEAITADIAIRVVETPEAHGAKRDGKEVYDAAMTNGSAVLTSASGPFVSGDVGKAITVRTVGAIANDSLSTTIASYQSATQVTLAAVANATVTNKQAVWGTDDTTAIKQALNAAVTACQADKTYYCELQFSAGIYIVAAPTTKGGATRGNAQIPLPNIEPAIKQKVTIVLKGLGDAGAWSHWNQTEGQKSGAVIRTMLVGQTPDGTWKSPSVFGGPTVDLVSGEVFSNIRIIVDGITVVAPWNPSVIAMDLRRCVQADVPNFTALADAKAFDLNGSATNDNGIGLYMPSQNNNDSCNIGTYSCEGFYYGLGFSDHLVALRLGLIYCNTAMFINSPTGVPVHGASITYASIEACVTGIEKPAAGGNKFPLWIGQVNTEGVATAVKDSGNNLRGYIGWTKNEDNDPTVVGCANIKIDNLYRTRGNITAPAIPGPGSSPFTPTPIFRDAAVTVSGGTVTIIAVDGVATGITSNTVVINGTPTNLAGTVIVPSGKSITLTYSSAPTWVWTLL